MTDKPVSVYFTAENRTFWLHGLFWGLVTLGLAFALRMLEWPCWQNPEYRLGSEWLLATHDAYHWVAGAEGFGWIELTDAQQVEYLHAHLLLAWDIVTHQGFHFVSLVWQL